MQRIDAGPSQPTTSRDRTGIQVSPPPDKKRSSFSIVKIPFSREMAAAALDGTKMCTTRSEKKGEIGDFFTIEDALFQIVDVWESPLYIVHRLLYRLEGTDSPEAFEHLWRGLHRGHFSSERVYYVHFFAHVRKEAIL